MITAYTVTSFHFCAINQDKVKVDHLTPSVLLLTPVSTALDPMNGVLDPITITDLTDLNLSK